MNGLLMCSSHISRTIFEERFAVCIIDLYKVSNRLQRDFYALMLCNVFMITTYNFLGLQSLTVHLAQSI